MADVRQKAKLRTGAELFLSALADLPPGKRQQAWEVFERKATRLVDRPIKRKATKHSQSWKDLEREAAEALGGKRISRGDNFAREDVDVVIDDFPELKIDGKYRNTHAHHTFMAEIERKYCKTDVDEPLLITKHKGQKGAFATVRLPFLGQLLTIIRVLGED